jgi:Tol biopolymer transport system component/C-terminal processing protease CtpA/Prc
MRIIRTSIFTLLALAPLSVFAAAEPIAQPSFAQPAIAPDGRSIAFVSGGAIWNVPVAGGVAHLVFAGDETAERPLYSPDGRKLAFESAATGNGDLYVLDLASGALQRITHADSAEQLDAWSHDGEWLYFDSTRDSAGNMHGIYRVRASGGTPMPVSLDAYRNAANAAPSPDGRRLVLVGGGLGDFQWWRNGHSHIDEGALWLLEDDGSHRYTRLTADGARTLWPMWPAAGTGIFYMSDRGGAENLWRVDAGGGDAQRITHFEDGRVLWPTISADGRTIAFERDFGVWTADTASGEARALAIVLQGGTRGGGVEHETLGEDFSELALSPDGRKVAVIVRGEVFAVDAENGGAAQRVTRTPGAEYGLAWAPDSRRLVYGAERGPESGLYLHDFGTAEEIALSSGAGEDTAPTFAADGKSLAFVRDGRELMLIDMHTRHARRLAEDAIDLRRPLTSPHPLAWSPDGRWIAWLAWDARMFRNAHALRVADGHRETLSGLANTSADDIVWAADGRSVLFATGQRTEPGRIAEVDLVPRTPVFREDTFRDLFNESTPPGTPAREATEDGGRTAGSKDAAKREEQPAEPTRIDARGIRERLDLLPVGIDVGALRISADGKLLLLTATVADKGNLYTWSLDPLAKDAPVATQITSTPGEKRAAQFSADGKSVWYLDDGHVFSVALKDGAKPKPLEIEAEMDIDFEVEKQVAFEQAWTWLRNNFHDPAMNGVDWNAIHARYAPRITGARAPNELNRLLNLLVGELDASHSGVRAATRPENATGRTGLRFDRREYEDHGRFRISAIVPLSPAAVSGGIAVGDWLLAVDGTPLGADSDLDALLAWRIGRKTALRVAASADGRGAREVEVKPIASSDASALAYKAWVADNRAYVERVSDGRFGYVHLRDMSMDSLQRLYRDLDAQNATREGVVIDVRNNFGGFVNAYALDVLARRPYLNMRFRGIGQVAPARSILGQRSLERPTVLVTNRVTLSDGEDFSEGYRRLGLGPIVGEPTAGWIIYTSNEKLIDGSTLRLPFITVTDNDGRPLEMHPRPVDVPVARPLGETYRGVDSELDAAVRALAERIAAPPDR